MDKSDEFFYYRRFKRLEKYYRRKGNIPVAEFYRYEKELEDDLDIDKRNYYVREIRKSLIVDFLTSIELVKKKYIDEENLKKKQEEERETKKRQEEQAIYFESIRKKDFYDLNEKEASDLGLHNIWFEKMILALRLVYYALPAFSSDKYNYLLEYAKLFDIPEGAESINFYRNIYKEYKGMELSDILSDIKKRQKEKERKI